MKRVLANYLKDFKAKASHGFACNLIIKKRKKN